ncbi:DUF397 domain-containing protein [Actinoallomurus purpureus]|nr:DUF397 domain-containing protein [Actinoallomurus purpureus]MCO6005203.1 DUF397 domain-containing protein [Actinoallomurus purpureus]
MGLITDWRKSERSAQNGGACVEVAVVEKAAK